MGAHSATFVAFPPLVTLVPNRGGVSIKCLFNEPCQAHPGLVRDSIQLIERLARTHLSALQAGPESNDDVALVIRPTV